MTARELKRQNDVRKLQLILVNGAGKILVSMRPISCSAMPFVLGWYEESDAKSVGERLTRTMRATIGLSKSCGSALCITVIATSK